MFTKINFTKHHTESSGWSDMPINLLIDLSLLAESAF